MQMQILDINLKKYMCNKKILQFVKFPSIQYVGRVF